jgi:hypothetical protein
MYQNFMVITKGSFGHDPKCRQPFASVSVANLEKSHPNPNLTGDKPPNTEMTSDS